MPTHAIELGDRIIISAFAAHQETPQRATVVKISTTTSQDAAVPSYTVRLEDSSVLTVLPKNIKRHCPRSVFISAPSVKDILRWMWGDIVFRRVSRSIAKYQDMSIWWRDTENPSQTRYLGDDKSLLKQYSDKDIERYVSIEYDYFYGFTRDTPLHDANDPYAGESLHYASQNYCSIDLTKEVTGQWKKDYTVQPPQPGQLVCGLVRRTPRGVTFDKWWQCPEEFYRFWKMILLGTDLSLEDNLKRLRGYKHIFQALALVVMYGKRIPPHRMQDLPVPVGKQPYVETFIKQITWMCDGAMKT